MPDTSVTKILIFLPVIVICLRLIWLTVSNMIKRTQQVISRYGAEDGGIDDK